jgi:hypothetical protein
MLLLFVIDYLAHERWRAYLKDVLNIQANMEQVSTTLSPLPRGYKGGK